MLPRRTHDGSTRKGFICVAFQCLRVPSTHSIEKGPRISHHTLCTSSLREQFNGTGSRHRLVSSHKGSLNPGMDRFWIPLVMVFAITAGVLSPPDGAALVKIFVNRPVGQPEVDRLSPTSIMTTPKKETSDSLLACYLLFGISGADHRAVWPSSPRVLW